MRGILTLLLVVVIAIIIFFLFVVLSRWKLMKQGHRHMTLIQDGKVDKMFLNESHYITNDSQNHAIQRVVSKDNTIMVAAHRSKSIRDKNNPQNMMML